MRRGEKELKKIKKSRLNGTLFILPAFIWHFCIIVVPACSMFYYSLTKWNGLSEPKFIGLDNFKRMLHDTDFLFAIRNNLIWTVLFLFVPLVLGLGMALIFTKIGRVQMPLRTLCFLPYVISAAVSGKIFTVFYSPYSGIATIFDKLGVDSMANFAPLGERSQALYAAAFVDNWHWWGFVLVLMMSALHQVSAELYEAADMEGAGFFQKLLNVTIPQIRPTIAAYFIFVIIATFTTFDYVWIMTQGGPAGATELLSTRIYKTNFLTYESGYSSAMSLSVCLFALAVYLLLNHLQRKKGGTGA
ncbi:MAG: sugar ABC transporter permease [Eubacteriales bacterium]|nr:sugar ABC transporter permease [Eubacteriales bacterium]